MKNTYRLVVFKGYDLEVKPIIHTKTVNCKNKSEVQTEFAKRVLESLLLPNKLS